jgi:hypothetical protein
MPIDPTHPPLSTAAATVALIATPMAGAAPTPPEGCLVVPARSTCQRPGVVEITRPRPSVTVHPYGTMPILRGVN